MNAVVEIYSTPKNDSKGTAQAATYGMYMLQARPDLGRIPAFYLTKDGKVVLLLVSADKVCHSGPLTVYLPLHYKLVYGFLWRIYKPVSRFRDFTIARIGPSASEQHYTFQLTVTPTLPGIAGQPITRSTAQSPGSPETTAGWVILSTISSPTQGTHVFSQTRAVEGPNSRAKVRIIKEKYIDTKPHRRYLEHDVLNHIHKDGVFPGVAQLVSFEFLEVFSLGGRQKLRICMEDSGVPFMDSGTPLEAIKVAYDLLEGTYSRHISCRSRIRL